MEVRKKPRTKQQTEEVYIPPQATEEDISEPVLSPEDKKLQDLYNTLKDAYGDSAPLVSSLEAWKKRWGNIHISKVSSERNEYYIWRTLRRYEYKEINVGNALDDPESTNELLVEKCLLFPDYNFAFRNQTDAGIITTLGQQISYKSGFVTPQEALSLIFIA